MMQDRLSTTPSPPR